MNKKLSIVIDILLSCLSIFFLYETIGYLILGIKTPNIYGIDGNTSFLGMYILSVTYFLLLTITLLLFIIKHSSKNKKEKN